MSAIIYSNQTPGVADFIQLRIDARLSAKGQVAATKGLEGTFFSNDFESQVLWIF
jgi:hypothetical protein